MSLGSSGLFGDGTSDVELVADYLSEITGDMCIPRPDKKEIYVAACCNSTLHLHHDNLFFSCGHWWQLTTPDPKPLADMVSHCTWQRDCKKCKASAFNPQRITAGLVHNIRKL